VIHPLNTTTPYKNIYFDTQSDKRKVNYYLVGLVDLKPLAPVTVSAASDM
jgi:hypothetical protein